MSDPVCDYEIRSARQGEEEKFLAHMCRCFSINIDAARPIFYNDPFFDLSHKKVLIDSSGEIVSSLTIVPSAVRVTGGALVSVAGLAGVCTAPNSRRKGYARSLIRATMQTAPAEFGYAVAALSTDRPDIYRSIGFENCALVLHWTAHRNLLPPSQDTGHAAPASIRETPELLPEIEALYQHSFASQPGIFIRSEPRWKTIFADDSTNSVIVWRHEGRLEGCIIYRLKEQREEQIFEVVDLLATSAAARRGLIGYVQGLSSVDLVTGQMRTSDLRKLGIQHTPRFTSYRREGLMMSIIDFDACVSQVAATGTLTPVIRRSESGLTIRLENSVSAGDRKPLRLFSVSTERIGVAIAIAPADEMTGDWISVDTGAMAQLFFGYRSASKLRSQDRLWASSKNALAIADSLFPGFETYIGPLDAF